MRTCRIVIFRPKPLVRQFRVGSVATPLLLHVAVGLRPPLTLFSKRESLSPWMESVGLGSLCTALGPGSLQGFAVLIGMFVVFTCGICWGWNVRRGVCRGYGARELRECSGLVLLHAFSWISCAHLPLGIEKPWCVW